MRLPDAVALITGAGSGMGRAGALRFAREGASIVVADLDVDAAAATAKLVEEAGGQAIAVGGDVSRPEDCARMVAAGLEAFGKLSIAWANAGIPQASQPIEVLTAETFDRMMAVNARGAWLTAQAAVPALRANGGGAIVITSSMSGLKGRSGNSAYSMSKGATVMMTHALAVELAPYGIRVNSLCPVAADTPMFPRFLEGAPDFETAKAAVVAAIPLKRLCTAEDVANAALFLASDEAAMITGVNLRVDGGLGA